MPVIYLGMGFLFGESGIPLSSRLYLTQVSYGPERGMYIPGTEDMTDAYHDYAFHWKWFFLSLIAILPLSAIIGGIVALVGLFL